MKDCQFTCHGTDCQLTCQLTACMHDDDDVIAFHHKVQTTVQYLIFSRKIKPDKCMFVLFI